MSRTSIQLEIYPHCSDFNGHWGASPAFGRTLGVSIWELQSLLRGPEVTKRLRGPLGLYIIS